MSSIDRKTKNKPRGDFTKALTNKFLKFCLTSSDICYYVLYISPLIVFISDFHFFKLADE